MSDDKPIPLRAVSSQDVLEILRDNLGHFSRMNFEREPWLTLDFDTPLIDWADQYEVESRSEAVGEALNAFFGVAIGPDEWKHALDPVKKSTLRPLCETVARHLQLPATEPAGYFGAACREAGAFLTLRALLHRSGVRVRGLGPSTLLSTVARDHFNEILDSAARLAPGLLPTPVLTPSKPKHDAALRRFENIGAIVCLFGLLPVFLAWIAVALLAVLSPLFGWYELHSLAESIIGNSWVQIVVLLVTGASLGGGATMALRRRIPLKSAKFEGFHTFGDLARAVAAYAPPASSE